MSETKQKYTCKYCSKEFMRESSLLVHVCEQKKRFQSQDDPAVKIGYQAYLKFYQITQGSARLKTYDDFARSSYYRAFVKFGRYTVSVRAINIIRFTEWLITNNKKLDHWCRDSLYNQYLLEYTRKENVNDALERAVNSAVRWSEETGTTVKDYLRYGNVNMLCYEICSGRVTAWSLYNCASGNEFLEKCSKEQLEMIWPWIDADVWAVKFKRYPADAEYCKSILKDLGW